MPSPRAPRLLFSAPRNHLLLCARAIARSRALPTLQVSGAHFDLPSLFAVADPPTNSFACAIPLRPAPSTSLKVWQLHRRIKCYIVLSVVATVVDLAIGIGGVVYVVYEPATTLIVATWTMRCAATTGGGGRGGHMHVLLGHSVA